MVIEAYTFLRISLGRSYRRSRQKWEIFPIFVPPVPELEPGCGKMCAETCGLHFSVGASAFMRGKGRFSAPGKARLQSMRFSTTVVDKYATLNSLCGVILRHG